MSRSDLIWQYNFSRSEYLVLDDDSTPYIRGRRITIKEIGTWAYKRRLAPVVVADQLDLPEAAIHEALAFYHLNWEYFARLEELRQPPSDGRSDQAIPEDGEDDTGQDSSKD